jgi:hypothetical protein
MSSRFCAFVPGWPEPCPLLWIGRLPESHREQSWSVVAYGGEEECVWRVVGIGP